jgi:hypothetical protein
MMRAYKTIFILICLMQSTSAWGQSLVENQAIDFGTVFVESNAANYDIALKSNCSGYTIDAQYYVFTAPQCGSYTASGYPPNTTLTVTITNNVDVDPDGGSGPNFTMISPFHTPNNVKTNGAGEVTFEVGATLRTSGSGGFFASDSFSGSYSVTVAP